MYQGKADVGRLLRVVSHHFPAAAAGVAVPAAADCCCRCCCCPCADEALPDQLECTGAAPGCCTRPLPVSREPLCYTQGAQHSMAQRMGQRSTALAAAGSTEACHVLAKERPQRCSSWAAVARCGQQHGIYIAAGVAWLGFLRYECSWWGSTARPVRHGQLAMANCQGLSFAAL